MGKLGKKNRKKVLRTKKKVFKKMDNLISHSKIIFQNPFFGQLKIF